MQPFHPYTEVRNRLSELFLEALADSERTACVLWLHTFFRICRPGSLSVSLLDLAEAVSREAINYPGADGRRALESLLADFDLLQLRRLESQEIYRGNTALDALRWSVGDAIELYPEFHGHAAYAARRAEMFWTVMEQLRQEVRPATGGVEDAVARGVLVFNAGLFFEYHEVLEDHWRVAAGDGKRFLQGLIQVAVGLQHWQNGNYDGAVILLREGAHRLCVGRPHMLRLDVESFYRQVQAARSTLEALGRERTHGLSPSLIPKQRLLP